MLALEGHGPDRVFTDAVGSLRVRLTVTGPGGHSWWDRGRPSAVHELVSMLHRQEAALADLTVSPGLELRAERLDRRPAGAVPLSHPLVAAVLRARRSVGLPQVTGDGSTDANAALAAGIPAVALGCCEGAGMHAPTERIRADSIGTGAGQLRAVLAEILERNP